MTKLPWSSERTFRLWRYNLSHSELALRSYDGGEDMLEVLFDGVDRIELSNWYQGGIEVSLVADHPSAVLVNPRKRSRFYRIAGPAGEGFVAAGRLRIARLSRAGEELELLVGIPGAPAAS